MARLDFRQWLNALRGAAVFNRRVAALAAHLADAIPNRGSVLDLGCGNGAVAAALMALRPDLHVQGADVTIRPNARIPVAQYNGTRLPVEDRSFDYVMLVDVLHHTEDPAALLGEAARVVRLGVVVKDYCLEGTLARPTLRLMDWVGNFGHRVVFRYNYMTRKQWQGVFYKARLATVTSREKLALYPWPLNLVFDRDLHFVTLLAPRTAV